MSTTLLTVTQAFQEVGQGPLVFTIEEGESVLVHMASSLPAADAATHKVARTDPEDRSWFNYTGALKVYAKKDNSIGNRTVRIVYTEG